MIAKYDFDCYVCRSRTFQGEECYIILDHPVWLAIDIKVCAICGVGAEALGWRIA